MRNIFIPDPDTMTEILMLFSDEDLPVVLRALHAFLNPQTKL